MQGGLQGGSEGFEGGFAPQMSRISGGLQGGFEGGFAPQVRFGLSMNSPALTGLLNNRGSVYTLHLSSEDDKAIISRFTQYE